MADELRELIARDMAHPLLMFLHRWGFMNLDSGALSAAKQQETAARYLSGVARAVLETFVAQREAIEKERFDG